MGAQLCSTHTPVEEALGRAPPSAGTSLSPVLSLPLQPGRSFPVSFEQAELPAWRGCEPLTSALRGAPRGHQIKVPL